MESSRFHMIDVSSKPATPRRAKARGRIFMSMETAARIARGDMPKGDVLAMAEVAGLMAVKNAVLLLPLCHPLPIEAARVSCRVVEDGVEVVCEVGTVAKTGVEMEALCGVQAALLSIYDLTKIVDPALEISDVRLDFKDGGKSKFWAHPKANLEPRPNDTESHLLKGLHVAVITMSDRCARGESQDRSGPELGALAVKDGASLIASRLVPDDIVRIRQAVRDVIEIGADVVLMTGGTGAATRDVTPEALRGLIDKELTGIGELLRFSGGSMTKKSYLSRSLAGLSGDRLLIAFPGSVPAVSEGYVAVRELIPHVVTLARGRDPHARPGV